jgi:endonuclease-3
MVPSSGEKAAMRLHVIRKPPRTHVSASQPMSPEEITKFLQALARVNPSPKTELEYQDPFTLLIAVVLSAQTTDVQVNRATRTLFAEASTPQAILALGEEGVARHIRTLGLWRSKARNVVELSRLLIERHGGNVPTERKALEALPGVGRKTANVVLNAAFGAHTVAVDTHVFRLCNRTGLAPGTTPEAVEEALLARVPPEFLPHLHHLLILHGRYVCKARKPECWRCVGAPWCHYPAKTPPPSDATFTSKAAKPKRR